MIKKGKKVIAKDVKVCSTVFSKSMGLRFKKIRDGEAYVFPFEVSRRMIMDMFFVFCPIDIVLLDENFRVVEFNQNFLPFSIYISTNKASFAVELPKGSVKKNEIELGDILTINV
ncbi:DUF192 domain-containing protein [Candidatus Woesearchaeota archaeon]|nr:DUF192 domain-containing protein [Candidatus Woesearchaeota archaeon]